MGYRNEALEKNDKILLDVKLIEMINACAFRAVLDNGHPVVAYQSGNRKDLAVLCVGQRVRVAMSPFDMGRGEIIPQETKS